MRKTKIWLGVGLALVAIVVITAVYLSGVNIPVLEPKGPIADQEFRLLLLVTGAMLIVVIPVFILLGYIVWHYREDNPKRGKYMPNWEHSRWLEGLWWFIPTVLIAIVSVITWRATYQLNPYRPIATNVKALKVQVIALDWKWLFIYPSLNIASVNMMEFPLKVPLHLYLTSDAPMNSFWLPQLSGQIFAMAGMQTQLYLSADQVGTYYGRSANISGAGFASMQFSAKSVSQASFQSWVKSVRKYAPKLDLATYNQLRAPFSDKVHYYSLTNLCLFNAVINSYMAPANAMMAGK